MKPFDLEKAKAGKPICTKNGRNVRIICFDRLGDYPILGLVSEEHEEVIYSYNLLGRVFERIATNYDLFMRSEKKIGWINLWNIGGGIRPSIMVYNTKQEAEEAARKCDGILIGTIKIEWEE